MKWTPLFLLALVVPLAAATDPGTAALGYLAKVREKKVDATSGRDTAISPETVNDKRREITRTIERLSKELVDGTLELGEIKEDGGVAGVIVRQVNGFDADAMQVIAVAMVKRGDEWLPAPVPASFENTGAAYDPVLAPKLPALEAWMLRQRVLDLRALRAESTLRMQRQIEQSLPKRKLLEMKAAEVTQGFTEACVNQDLSAVLGYLGGLNRTLPEDWSARNQSAAKAIREKGAADGPWRLLLSPEVFRLQVHAEMEETSGAISFACLDPMEKSGAFVILHLDLSKSNEGLWQIDLPAAFLNGEGDLPENENLDADLLAKLPEKIRGKFPAIFAPTAEKAGEILLSKLRQDSLDELFPLIQWDAKNPENALKTIGKASQVWRALHDLASVGFPLKLALQEQGNEAAVIAQFFSTRDPERTDLRMLSFQKQDGGWFWNPSPVSDAAAETDEGKLAAWFQQQRPALASRWQAELLANSSEIKTLGEARTIPDEEARKILSEWLIATRVGNLEKALSLTAWVSDGRGGARMLRNLGHEVSTARKEGAAAEIVEIYHAQHWTAVGVKTSSADTPANFPLYVLIQTDNGPRILLEVDLFASAGRGRDFLNKASLERLQGLSSPALADELGTLLESYKKAVVK